MTTWIWGSGVPGPWFAAAGSRSPHTRGAGLPQAAAATVSPQPHPKRAARVPALPSSAIRHAETHGHFPRESTHTVISLARCHHPSSRYRRRLPNPGRREGRGLGPIYWTRQGAQQSFLNSSGRPVAVSRSGSPLPNCGHPPRAQLFLGGGLDGGGRDPEGGDPSRGGKEGPA